MDWLGFEQHVVYASGQGSPAIMISVRASVNSKRVPPRWGGTSGAARTKTSQPLNCIASERGKGIELHFLIDICLNSGII